MGLRGCGPTVRRLTIPRRGQPQPPAVERLVAGLQDGLDRADADAYDRQFAADVLWGSPYGATVSGYETLNAAHHSLMAAGVAPRSRYEILRLLSPRPGVAIAHVRRNDLSEGEGERFSEMAMYVLVERGRRVVARGPARTRLLCGKKISSAIMGAWDNWVCGSGVGYLGVVAELI